MMTEQEYAATYPESYKRLFSKLAGLHTKDGFVRWILYGIHGGDFVHACMEDKLVATYISADDTSHKNIPLIVQWLYSDCPAAARGASVDRWASLGGLIGINETKASISGVDGR